MLSTLEVISRQGSLLRLPLGEETAGLFVEDIEGLEPVKATLVSSNFANLDGAQYHSSRREPRNLIVRLGMEPDYLVDDVQDIRNRLYEFFMPKSEVQLRFIMDNGLTVDILGRVEDFVAPLFVQEPVVTLTMLCFDPDFKSVQESVFESGTTSGTNEVILPYRGTVETGFLFTLLVNRDLPDFTIYHRPPDGTLRTLSFTHPLVLNDVLRINTSVGSKSVLLTRGNVESSLLYANSPQSTWLELQPGDNAFRVYAAGAEIPYNIRYTNKYGGL